MKLETLFNNFDQLADTPNAVGKMRELILQLATHGKLVEQSGDDEPASALAGRIEKHIEVLRGRKEFRGSPVEPLDRDELPEIPSSWEWVRLGNAVDYGSSDKAESAAIPKDAWLLDLEDIEKDTSRLLQRKSFRDSPSKSTKTAFALGDVLYGKLRPYLNKVIVADAPGYCTTEIIPIRAFGFIDSAYLCHALKRPEFIAYANSKSYGMNLPRLGTEDARSAPFPLPPLAEQKRIAAKVDELMALCDRLEAQQQERETRHAAIARASLVRFADAPTPANLPFLFHPCYALSPAELRSAILRQVFLGRMRWEPLSLEPDRSHLSRLQVEHRETWKRAQLAAFEEKHATPRNDAWMKRYVPTDLPETADLPNIPEHWAWIPLELACPTIIDSPHRTPVYSEAGEFPALRPRDVAGGTLKLHQTARVETSEYERQTERRKPRCGDIVYSRELSFGWAVILPEKPQVCLSQGMVSMQTASEVDTSFLCKVLNSPIVRDQAEAAAIGAAHPHVNLKDIRVLKLPFPPLAEQRRIVAKVGQLMALVDALETQIAASRTTAEKLLQALVAELTDAQAVPL